MSGLLTLRGEARSRLSGEVNRVTILMLCDGRARAGWKIVVVCPKGSPDEWSLTMLPPYGVFVPPPDSTFEVLNPRALLS